MSRSLKPSKSMIFVFCEGESEQAYMKAIAEQFSKVAIIRCPKGLFEEARDKFNKDAKYKSYIEATDEIWFFFDVEESDREKWDSRLNIVKKLRRLRKDPRITVRMLMTTACVEYWFWLHYCLESPSLQTVADKERMLRKLKDRVHGYSKGDEISTAKIAKEYPEAVKNGQKVLSNLLSEGPFSSEESDQRNEWLYRSRRTFTTVHEAIQFLESLKKVL